MSRQYVAAGCDRRDRAAPAVSFCRVRRSQSAATNTRPSRHHDLVRPAGVLSPASFTAVMRTFTVAPLGRPASVKSLSVSEPSSSHAVEGSAQDGFRVLFHAHGDLMGVESIGNVFAEGKERAECLRENVCSHLV